MRVISWNINSVRAHLPRLLEVLRRHEPDVLCLQETKVEDDGFPIMQLEAAGYHAILHGQLSHNGVAILVHDPVRKRDLRSFNENPRKVVGVRGPEPTEIMRGFPGDPVPREARVISACVGKLHLVNVYVVNGQSRDSDQFMLKKRWMEALGKWLHSLPKSQPLLVVGDFNVAPDDRDVWDPVGLWDRIHCTIEERTWLKGLQGSRLKDLLRTTTQDSGIYTWWPYQRDAFERDEGLRFDLALGDDAMSKLVKKVWVDKEERRPEEKLGKPSDHAPLIVDIEP
jgi:exodeoxyribonuclease III